MDEGLYKMLDPLIDVDILKISENIYINKIINKN